MALSHEEIAALLDLIERSNIEYLEVEVEGTRIVADRSGSRPSAPSNAAAQATTPSVSGPDPATPPSLSSADADPDDGSHTVTAPMVGVFYRSPEPGAPAFVELGSQIVEGDTIGLIEVMKMFNSVTAPVSGEVVKILASTGEFVEYGQPLFRIRQA